MQIRKVTGCYRHMYICTVEPRFSEHLSGLDEISSVPITEFVQISKIYMPVHICVVIAQF